jgi:hypothetical protein
MSEPTLDDLFTGNEEEVSPESTPAEQEPVKDPEPEKPSEEPTADPQKEAPAASEKLEDEIWTKAMALDERRKRQAAEAKLSEYENPKVTETVPDVIDDQQGYNTYVSKKIEDGILSAKIDMSRLIIMQQDPDYEQKEQEFLELAKENQQLAKDMFKHEVPAKFVVDTVNKHREFKEMQDVDTYKSKLRAEIETEIREKLKAEMGSESMAKDQVSSLKPSLANARASKDQGPVINRNVDDLFS